MRNLVDIRVIFSMVCKQLFVEQDHAVRIGMLPLGRRHSHRHNQIVGLVKLVVDKIVMAVDIVDQARLVASLAVDHNPFVVASFEASFVAFEAFVGASLVAFVAFAFVHRSLPLAFVEASLVAFVAFAFAFVRRNLPLAFEAFAGASLVAFVAFAFVRRNRPFVAFAFDRRSHPSKAYVAFASGHHIHRPCRILASVVVVGLRNLPFH